MLGKLRNYVWLRWTLLCEYPEEFFFLPAVLLVFGLILFGIGMAISDPFTVIVLVYSGYMMGLVAVVCFIACVLVLRPDRDE